MKILQQIEHEQLREQAGQRPGDQVKVHVRIKEGDKERVQIFEGIVLKVKRGGITGAFTVRKMSYGIGIERTFPLHSPSVEKVEIVTRNRVRRARLFYLRGRRGKAARLRELDYRLEAAKQARRDARNAQAAQG